MLFDAFLTIEFIISQGFAHITTPLNLLASDVRRGRGVRDDVIFSSSFIGLPPTRAEAEESDSAASRNKWGGAS